MGIRTGMQQITGHPHVLFWKHGQGDHPQVHGYCLAGGCELAMMADLVTAATTATARPPGLRGLGTSAATGVILAAGDGMRKAKELYYTATASAARRPSVSG